MNTKIKLTILLIGLVFIGAGIFVIPHSMKVSKFENDLKSFESSVINAKSNLKTVDDLSNLCELVNNLKKMISSVDYYENKLLEITQGNYFLRSSFVRIKYTDESISKLRDSINEIFNNLNTHIATATEKYVHKNEDVILKTQNFSAIKEKGELFAIDIELMQNCLQELQSFISNNNLPDSYHAIASVNYNYLEKNKIHLLKFLNQGVNRINAIVKEEKEKYPNRISNAKNIKDINNAITNNLNFCNQAREVLVLFNSIGADLTLSSRVDNEIKSFISTIRGDLQYVNRLIDAQNNSQSIMQSALSYADKANNDLNRLEKFASSEQILNVFREWDRAYNQSLSAKGALNIARNNQRQEAVYTNLMTEPRNNVDRIIRDIGNHRDLVWRSYAEAKNQESTMLGQAQRTAGRLLNRATQAATQSRIGREISISVKTLVLGTRAFFDLMNPDTDVLTWATSYSKDVESLMKETDEVMRMSGPSLTGKNTIIERLTEEAYQKSFNE